MAREKGGKRIEKMQAKVEKMKVEPYVKDKLMEKMMRWKKNLERERNPK